MTNIYCFTTGSISLYVSAALTRAPAAAPHVLALRVNKHYIGSLTHCSPRTSVRAPRDMIIDT